MFGFLLKQIWKDFFHQEYNINIILKNWGITFFRLTRPQVPCVTQKGSKELDLQNWLETWCRSQLLALKGVEGSCWKLRD
jgi:hypothetical protein